MCIRDRIYIHPRLNRKAALPILSQDRHARVYTVAAPDVYKRQGVVLQEKLKEYVGHTPIQVAAGAILGILIAFILDPMFI